MYLNLIYEGQDGIFVFMLAILEMFCDSIISFFICLRRCTLLLLPCLNRKWLPRIANIQYCLSVFFGIELKMDPMTREVIFLRGYGDTLLVLNPACNTA